MGDLYAVWMPRGRPVQPNRIEIDGAEARIHIRSKHGDFTASVDAIDVSLIGARRWHLAAFARSPLDGAVRAYVASSKKTDGVKVTTYLHRLITSAPDGFEVDHIDGNALNNRRSNLRVVSMLENRQNTRRARGYYWSDRVSAYLVEVNDRKRKRYVGLAHTEADARAMWLEAKRSITGLNWEASQRYAERRAPPGQPDPEAPP